MPYDDRDAEIVRLRYLVALKSRSIAFLEKELILVQDRAREALGELAKAEKMARDAEDWVDRLRERSYMSENEPSRS